MAIPFSIITLLTMMFRRTTMGQLIFDMIVTLLAVIIGVIISEKTSFREVFKTSLVVMASLTHHTSLIRITKIGTHSSVHWEQ
jgi:Na+/proline symporter